MQFYTICAISDGLQASGTPDESVFMQQHMASQTVFLTESLFTSFTLKTSRLFMQILYMSPQIRRFAADYWAMRALEISISIHALKTKLILIKQICYKKKRKFK